MIKSLAITQTRKVHTNRHVVSAAAPSTTAEKTFIELFGIMSHAEQIEGIRKKSGWYKTSTYTS